jgi:hypothetical protein
MLNFFRSHMGGHKKCIQHVYNDQIIHAKTGYELSRSWHDNSPDRAIPIVTR